LNLIWYSPTFDPAALQPSRVETGFQGRQIHGHEHVVDVAESDPLVVDQSVFAELGLAKN
jgi:hypothetical protein